MGFAAVGGLLGCCFGASVGTGLCLTCFPCMYLPCYYADNAALVDGTTDVTSWSVDCVSMSLASLCCCAWVVTSTKRSEMRYALGLPEERCCPCTPAGCGDELNHLCCMPCALIEERKVLEQNGCTREKPAVLKYKEIMAAKEGGGGSVEAAVTEQPIK